MAEHFRESQAPVLLENIERHRAAERADADITILQAAKSSAQMRLAGGFITGLSLGSRTGWRTEAHPILYAEEDTSKPKLVASHAMLPVGPYDGAGGQHGIARWVDYDVVDRRRLFAPNYDRITALADTADLSILLGRELALSPTEFSVMTHLQNTGDGTINTSLGEHLYFVMPDGAAVHDLRVNDDSVDTLLGKDAADAIAAGQAQFWGEFPGYAQVDFPDQSTVLISSSVRGQQSNPEQLGLLFWQRPGEPFVCIEPTYGYGISEDGPINNGLVIPAGGMAALTTTIELVSGPSA